MRIKDKSILVNFFISDLSEFTSHKFINHLINSDYIPFPNS
ncbi:hypothetical protein M901_0422 [Bacteriovorax sp. DB6_IX]|nr:hypothetical protein M901_0422 [Bacteriovorax sp. DB6_IX]